MSRDTLQLVESSLNDVMKKCVSILVLVVGLACFAEAQSVVHPSVSESVTSDDGLFTITLVSLFE